MVNKLLEGRECGGGGGGGAGERKRQEQTVCKMTEQDAIKLSTIQRTRRSRQTVYDGASDPRQRVQDNLQQRQRGRLGEDKDDGRHVPAGGSDSYNNPTCPPTPPPLYPVRCLPSSSGQAPFCWTRQRHSQCRRKNVSLITAQSC